MILIAGGTGSLGTRIVHLLDARRLPMRVMTRDVKHGARLTADRVTIVEGDVQDAEAVKRAVAGVRTVISAVQGFGGPGAAGPEAVDWQGNLNLIRAAQLAGVEQFILVSIQGARADHPIPLFQMKYRAEEALRSSGLAWTILRASAFMELWAMLIGEPLLKTGKALPVIGVPAAVRVHDHPAAAHERKARERHLAHAARAAGEVDVHDVGPGSGARAAPGVAERAQERAELRRLRAFAHRRDVPHAHVRGQRRDEIGRASCRERVLS